MKHKNDYWEDILDDINMDYLPLEYIKLIIVTFKDDKVWEIDLDKSRRTGEINDVEETLAEFFETYENSIVNIDFRLDTVRLKKDIEKRTHRFLKLNK